MQQKSHTFPEIKIRMVSFDMMPSHDEGIAQMVQYDLSRMKGVARQKRALVGCNAFRTWRSSSTIRVEFLDMSKPEEMRIRFRMIYELIGSFS